ncbi:MAG: segregation/condensation protein A [Oscillospiraceae bacterium]|nr:segregation/condensation protein A [Oscillospiraceae bacterium]
MEQISFKLEVFEGPLDLLLHLITKHKLNINDIPITELLDQYMDYISRMSEQNMEIAGEFLEMAARLVYIKTVSLLPQREEAEQLKKELQGRLIEYSLCKKTAEIMKERYIGNVFAVRDQLKIEFDNTYPIIHNPQELLDSYMKIQIKPPEEKVKTEAFNTIVKKKIVSVTSKIIFVLRRLYKSGSCLMNGLFEGLTDRSERVAVFLAVLELTKSGRIMLNDDNTEITFNRNHNKDQSEQIEQLETEVSYS